MKFEDYVNMAYHLASKFTCDKNVMIDRDDLIQLALMGLHKTLTEKKYKEGMPFSTYVYKVMKNEIQKEFRRFDKEYLRVYDVEPETIKNVHNPEELAHHKLNWGEVQEVLSEQEYKVVMMTAEGFNQKEISTEIGLSQSQVSRIFLRAKSKIREVVENGCIASV
ncbi:MAG: sigma-70 family RNA polymerase sigma factor [bacterium]|nr:sigma-70 family RNA polymerase sigma factor [bacterium]